MLKGMRVRAMVRGAGVVRVRWVRRRERPRGITKMMRERRVRRDKAQLKERVLNTRLASTGGYKLKEDSPCADRLPKQDEREQHARLGEG